MSNVTKLINFSKSNSQSIKLGKHEISKIGDSYKLNGVSKNFQDILNFVAQDEWDNEISPAIQEARKLETTTQPKQKSHSHVASHYNLNQFCDYGYEVVIYRQSGNIHKAYDCSTFDAAMSLINKSISRTGRATNIQRNTYDMLKLQLPYSGKGVNEGKKIGSYMVRCKASPYAELQRQKSIEKQEKTRSFLFYAVVTIVFLFIGFSLAS